MDGPKEIKAIWKRDYTVLAASASAIGGVLAVIELLVKKEKIKLLMTKMKGKKNKFKPK